MCACFAVFNLTAPEQKTAAFESSKASWQHQPKPKRMTQYQSQPRQCMKKIGQRRQHAPTFVCSSAMLETKSRCRVSGGLTICCSNVGVTHVLRLARASLLQDIRNPLQSCA